MSDLKHWIAAGQLTQFVLGTLDPGTQAQIFEAGKTDPEVRQAIAEAKEAVLHHAVAQAKEVDPTPMIASGVLEAYADDLLDNAARQQVEVMAMAHSAVSRAMDELKRKRTEAKVAEVAALDVQAFLASDLLMDYVLGACSDAERLLVEMARTAYPAVAEELAALEGLDEALVLAGAVNPPAHSRGNLFARLDAMAMPSDGWGLIMPPMGAASVRADFQPWVGMVNEAAIDPSQNLNVVPLDASRDMLTLFVVVRDGLEEETHLDSIERFYVLEGSCVIKMADAEVHLQQGDYLSIPKFTAHTVVVTSSIPCKLIVQQVAA